MPEGRKRRGTSQPLREVADISGHVWVKEGLEVVSAHFLNRRLGRPAIECNSVYSNKHSAAVSTQPAMDENSPPAPLLDNPEKLGDLFV